MTIQTKFDYKDECWIMHNNRPMKSVVSAIHFSDVNKLCFSKVDVSYTVEVLDPNHFGFCLNKVKLHENYVFKSKDECINSLR